MKKVLVILDNDFVNDGRVQKEIDIYKKNNIDFRILCYDFGKSYERDSNIIRIKNGLILKNKVQAFVNTIPLITFIWSRHIKKVLKEFEAEFIHVHDLYMLPPVKKAIKTIRSKFKLILDLHENYPYAIYNYQYANHPVKKYLVRPGLWKKKERSILKETDGIIVLDKTFGNALKEKYVDLSGKKFLEFPNYPDYSKLNQTQPIDFKINKNTMLYFGGVAKSRGLTECIMAFIEVQKSIDDIHFMIIGPVNKAYQKEFHELIHDQNNIQYINWINIEQLSSVMKECSFAVAPFYVNPQIESGIANKIFQYLYGKLPVIVSNARPMANLIKRHDCGEVFNSDMELRNAMAAYFNNVRLTKEKGVNGYNAILNFYSADRYEEKFLNFYEAL